MALSLFPLMSSRHHHPSMGLSASCSPAALLHPRWPPFPRPVPRGPRSLQPLPFQAWGLSWGFIRAEARVLCFALGLLSFFLTFIAEETLFQLFNHARRKHTIPVRPHLALGVCTPAELCLRAERPSSGDSRVVGSSVVRTGGNPVCVGGGESVEPSSGNPQPPCMKWDVLTFEASACGF